VSPGSNAAVREGDVLEEDEDGEKSVEVVQGVRAGYIK